MWMQTGLAFRLLYLLRDHLGWSPVGQQWLKRRLSTPTAVVASGGGETREEGKKNNRLAFPLSIQRVALT